jgi:glycosyltransferase involved in cell wall biosynthesis
MKILNIMLGTKKGGLEQVFVDYINAQLANEDEVHGICMENCPYVNELAKTKATIHTVNSRNVLNPLAVLKIRQMIKSINPDIIVLCGNRPVKMTISHFINKICKINIPVLSIMNNNHCYVKDVKYAAAVSTDIAKSVEDRGVKHTYYVPNTTIMQPKKEYKMSQVPVVGVIGRLHENKGFDIFLDAVKNLYDEGLDFKVVIAGDGPKKQELHEQAKALGIYDKIDFMGWIDDKVKFYNKIDIFCLSSRVEPFGIVLLEAMTRTVPIVSTDCQGPLDIFKNGEDAIVVPKKEYLELAKGLKQLIQDPELAKQFAEKSYDKANKEYSPAMLSQRLKTIFNEILENESK